VDSTNPPKECRREDRSTLRIRHIRISFLTPFNNFNCPVEHFSEYDLIPSEARFQISSYYPGTRQDIRTKDLVEALYSYRTMIARAGRTVSHPPEASFAGTSSFTNAGPCSLHSIAPAIVASNRTGSLTIV
jgi:hypothetical protein